jgi:hypothetical protein
MEAIRKGVGSERGRQSLEMLSVRQALGDNGAMPWRDPVVPDLFESSGQRIGASPAASNRGRFSGQSLRLEALTIIIKGLLYSRIFCRFPLDWLERLLGVKYSAAHGYSFKHSGSPLFDRYFPSSLTSSGLLGGAPSRRIGLSIAPSRPRALALLFRSLGSTTSIAKMQRLCNWFQAHAAQRASGNAVPPAAMTGAISRYLDGDFLRFLLETSESAGRATTSCASLVWLNARRRSMFLRMAIFARHPPSLASLLPGPATAGWRAPQLRQMVQPISCLPSFRTQILGRANPLNPGSSGYAAISVDP